MENKCTFCDRKAGNNEMGMCWKCQKDIKTEGKRRNRIVTVGMLEDALVRHTAKVLQNLKRKSEKKGK